MQDGGAVGMPLVTIAALGALTLLPVAFMTATSVVRRARRRSAPMLTLLALVSLACGSSPPPVEGPPRVVRGELTRAARAWLRCRDEPLTFVPVLEQVVEVCAEYGPAIVPSGASGDLIRDLGPPCRRVERRSVPLDPVGWRVSGCGVDDLFLCEVFGGGELRCMPDAMLGNTHPAIY